MGKGKMGKGSAGAFSEAQVEMYRECFKLMDIDKDGVINKNDLRAAFDNVGKQKTKNGGKGNWNEYLLLGTE